MSVKVKQSERWDVHHAYIVCSRLLSAVQNTSWTDCRRLRLDTSDKIGPFTWRLALFPPTFVPSPTVRFRRRGWLIIDERPPSSSCVTQVGVKRFSHGFLPTVTLRVFWLRPMWGCLTNETRGMTALCRDVIGRLSADLAGFCFGSVWPIKHEAPSSWCMQ